MRLAFESVLWGLRIDDLDYMLKVVKACGFEGVEIAQSPQNIFLYENDRNNRPVRDMDELLACFARHGLSLVGLAGGTLEQRIQFCGQHRGAYLYLDEWNDQVRQTVTRNPSFQFVLHPHWFMQVNKIRKAEEIIERVALDNLRLIIDTAHAVIAEDDLLAAISRQGPRLAAVHIKDWRPDYGRWSHRYSKGFCVPDQGIVPVREALELLRQQGFQGWLVSELDYFTETREKSMLQCGDWFMRHGTAWGIQCMARASQVKILEKDRRPNPSSLTGADLEKRIQSVETLSTLPTDSPRAFHEEVTKTIHELLKPGHSVVRLWSLDTAKKEFYLLAMHGGIGEDSGPTEIEAAQRMPARLARTAEVQIFSLDDETTLEQMDCREFAEDLQTRWLVTVPIFNATNAHHLRYLLTIYTDLDLFLRKRELAEFARFISVWADKVTGEMSSAASVAANYYCTRNTSSVEVFVNGLIHHLEKVFDCESTTIFLMDESQQRLLPTGSSKSRIRWKAGLAEHDQFYAKGEGLTGRVWQEREMMSARDVTGLGFHKGKAQEVKETKREQVLFAPLARLDGPVRGVVRLINKRRPPGRHASTMFNDDDMARLDAIIQAVLPYLELLINNDRSASALLRLNHELQNPLNSIAWAADLMAECSRVHGFDLSNKVFGGRDLIQEIIDSRMLMSTVVNNTKLFGESLDKPLCPKWVLADFTKEVLKPVFDLMRPVLRNEGIAASWDTAVELRIPKFYMDVMMMRQVWFNLCSNAVRYRKKGEDVTIDFGAYGIQDETGNWIEFMFEDSGMGLDPDIVDPEHLFLTGVRSVAAQKGHVTGDGIGLALVRTIVQAHGGNVCFLPSRYADKEVSTLEKPVSIPVFKNPTRLRLRLPRSLIDASFQAR
jgi:sugar phosphate isomerase/epimerase/signal transduction histidine kinase